MRCDQHTRGGEFTARVPLPRNSSEPNTALVSSLLFLLCSALPLLISNRTRAEPLPLCCCVCLSPTCQCHRQCQCRCQCQIPRRLLVSRVALRCCCCCWIFPVLCSVLCSVRSPYLRSASDLRSSVLHPVPRTPAACRAEPCRCARASELQASREDSAAYANCISARRPTVQ